MALIIVEGVDGSGKSTLTKRIAEASRYPLIVISRSKRFDTAGELETFLLWLKFRDVSIPHVNIVLDRHPLISETIYSSVLGREHLLSSIRRRYDLAETLSFFRNSIVKDVGKTLLVYCRPFKEEINERAKVNPQMDGVMGNMDRLVRRYDEFYRGWKETGLEYTMETGHSFTDTLHRIEETILEENLR